MEQWSTPVKNRMEQENLAPRSPAMYKTPVKQYSTAARCTAFQNNMGCISVLPSHITPPSGLTKFIARNPFETDLTNRLHLSMMSPTVFSKVSSPAQQSPEFSWSVDELALIKPVKIEEFPVQQIHCMDPETEQKAQAAIDRFFKQNKEIIPSPWELKRKDSRPKSDTDTPVKPPSDSNLDSSNSKKDGWCQTVLTFPPELPSHIVEILQPYFTFTQDQKVESDDANLSNNSLRRKLFPKQDDFAEEKEESSIYLSPVKMEGSLVLSSSPPQSGMLVHGAPLKSSNIDCRHDTSEIISSNLSPPNISPIHSTVNMSYESMRSRSRSIARLDFTTDMSIDQPSFQSKDYTNDFIDESVNQVDEQMAGNKADNFLRSDKFTNVSTDVDANRKHLARNSIRLKHKNETENTELTPKGPQVANACRYFTDCYKFGRNESCVFQQTNTALGISDQQSVSNTGQDTGYQTYSMNSITNVTDNSTPVKQRAYWGDRVSSNDEEYRLFDWKENMKNIFCSTPSRSNREKDNHIP